MSRKLIIGNWKMHGRLARNAELIDALRAGLAACEAEVGVAVPTAYLSQASHALAGSTIALSAQDASRFADDGAYTGETSANMLADLGVSYVLLGHSERRQYFQEDNAVLREKIEAVLKAGLKPVLCIGETLAEREAGEHLLVTEGQLEVLKALELGDECIVAYEPVWAIGTGKVASIEQVAQMHAHLKQKLLPIVGCSVNIRVLYGGSVKSDNASAILATPNVDGALVGGASLDAESFKKICQAAG
ncbi:triose-phosphate isomerase [Crenobacter cavernae]|uniref:Triosephosphate isomerase n=1 Tax=Crenobacter cavernae TaxID=2290923 RepID=A0ABY0FHQ4_9NEIS|nr:triose-phosphate isomerase [Crenobacter cavernae]RXZ44847.1 triose-phosphate isomerase [Crenobacter cavernae]